MRFIYLLIFTINLFADNYSFKNGFNETSIINSKEWNQLLYYKHDKSEVNNKDFFISDNGNSNPKEELLATLNSYSLDNINDNSTICKYPARYLFLSQFVDFKNYEVVNKKCKKLNDWEFLNKTKSISLILVSGYVSNPASTFGHSFIKLNTSDNNLFSSSVNYGALVPDNENMLKYIYKGLTGEYEAGFSDQYFYTQDMTYTNTEFRDMWEYKLNLTDFQQKLILLHIWEIVGKKYDYYFLNKNCGFRVTEVLNLVTKTDFLDKSNLWFLPVETFQDIESKEPNLISEVKFIPSNKRVFNAYFDRLNDNQKIVVKELLFNEFKNKDNFEKLNEDDKIVVLDFLLLYYKQSLVVDSGNKKLEEIKQRILIERFKYRVSNSKPINIENIESPAKNTNPINFEVFSGFDSSNEKFVGLSFSPYKQTSLGISNLNFDNLVALDGRLGISENKVFIDKFDLIKISKINLDKNNLLNEFNYNWSIHIGLENFNNKTTHFANFGIGENIYKGNNFIIYTFLNSSINDSNYLSVIPSVGIEYKENKTSFRVIQEKEIGIVENVNKDITSFELQYNLSKDYNVGYELKLIDSEYKNLVNFKLKF